MFVAWRELRSARGRFLLIGAVVALLTLLVGFLSGLTGGLALQNVSAVLAVPADRFVFSGGDDAPSFADSAVTARQAAEWSALAGVDSVEPLGIVQARAESGASHLGVAVLGSSSALGAPSAAGGIALTTAAASSLGVGVGGAVTIAGTSFTVSSIGGDDWYSHTPVVRLQLGDWQHLAAALGSPVEATVLAVRGAPDWASAEAATGTVTRSPVASLTAIGSFRSEIGSLLMMVAMLFGIAALVVGAFFTVWTMQRSGDVAVLKALGASTPSLLRDALGQALAVLLAGTLVGMAAVVALGALAGTALPFLLSPLTTLAPAALMIALGLLGAAAALRTVVSTDPLTALGSAR
ncbi:MULTISPECIES: FtsX-like permease family protein [unclassified Rathayibacter]|uniref:FtsX-like permease family protein n=1 Tax=unclassified Rathayibacter TaxID=2609250 RepID=UPI000CE8F549|nr:MULTISPECIES: ABC transporter permease [unclassified Rathayibacter]PPG51711.1 ABC transporter substrate-binding protein [Rathayibacter sp. AY2B3]PPI27326.1 ABC transporter substrate-binding protein [Rathayibacter sp. AY1B5]